MDTLQEAAVMDETLDPPDWAEMQALSHRIVEDAVAYLKDVRDRPVWRQMPVEVRAFFSEPLPRSPAPIAEVYGDVGRNVMAYPMGNIHPRFWSWYMGSSNFTGALGDFLAAIQGSNLGGGNHAAGLMDSQVVDWCKEMVGFPASASGTLVSGGSMANLIGLTVARNAKAGVDVRERGVGAIPKPLRFYASDQVHSCHRKAMEALGLGNRALRRVSTDADLRIDVDALKTAIAEDRAAGFKPACIIGTAGTVNTGAIDDLRALAVLAAEEDLWFHVDGCIGALIAIAPENRSLVAGIERAHSVALDPHKWLHAPFEAGCALVRDAVAHRNAFAVTPEYLESTPRGLASGQWLHDYGLQTSRGFRALKIWMSLKEHGIEKFGRLIDQNIAQAGYLTELIRAEPALELTAPTTINIVCFRHRLDGASEERLKAFNTEIMLRLQEEGIAAVSDTTVHGQHCLRVAITNHRTRRDDLDLLLRETLRIGAEIKAAALPD
ncbi:MAG: aspartate aminotransferase family protein [Mesorhizobium sp.]|uniref:pyridoxal phosphate-dependent decarboxylase family protein n=1 Tax=unclassified Mesorhizobium TaxID=325217 RepID=UPI000FCA8578|nr:MULTISPECIES: aspartate aminotransferase family protein [unclassified Mesorhizobium]RUV46029.1 aspartate aminotransferase family protein [Mesorhizobium sp. M1A.T.Ca.IN.004.03.1.1]RWG21503.1 MAG: aspartate aminotransferase family protein [Mesorhizobium sp.]RWI98268.1 MAG: aspartate aminotransferase family protein [Mesorhizobium sp.]RWK39682.1 MAG: aspartate aminotransferase family protein [Mesorhizobium sp.]RWK89002.1 MAG: aspartate aminotransferase family protein [Mesorhizobium sp.]